MLLERHRVTEPQRLHKPIHEFFGRQIDDMAAGVLFADMPGNGVHEMRFAKADTAIEEQGVESHGRGFGGSAGDRKGKLVRLANDEIGKGVTRVKPGAKWPAGLRPGV